MEKELLSELKGLVKRNGYKPGNEYILDVDVRFPMGSRMKYTIESILYDPNKDEISFRVYDHNEDEHIYWSIMEIRRRICMKQYEDVINVARAGGIRI